jgi:hypothetical protein
VTGIGWRSWAIDGRGRIASLGAPPGAGVWDQHGVTPVSCTFPQWWWDHPTARRESAAARRPHTPPGHDCICGIRVMPQLADLLGTLAVRPDLIGMNEMLWAALDDDQYRELEDTGMFTIPPVIGRVDHWGRVERGARLCDPRGTLRAEYARLTGPTLYLARYAARHATSIKQRHPDVEVRIGDSTGPAWLNEIATAEGVNT